MGNGSENNVVINLTGDSNGLKSALSQAVEAFKAITVAMTDASEVAGRVGASTTEMGDQWKMLSEALSPLIGTLSDLRAQMADTSGGMSDLDAQIVADTEQLRQNRIELQLLTEYQEVFGASQMEDRANWLAAADGVEQYTIRLNYLREQLALANAEMAQEEGIAGGGGGVGGIFGLLSGMAGGAFRGGGFSLGGLFGGMGEALGPLAGPLGMLGGAFDSVTGSIGNFVTQSGTMIASLVGWQAFNDVTQQVDGFVRSMFELNDMTQKNEYTWKYLFGGGDQGMMVSKNLMNWTKQASLTMPYTRQDLMGAITGMLSLPGMDSKQIEEYLPMLSSLGASRNPNLQLAQIANVVQGAEFGYTRQLRYELHINPDELIKYGLKATQRGGMGLSITDPSSLLPALMKYSQAHGYYKSTTDNAGVDIANNTWWGAMSSWVDRIQNFQMDAGQSMFSAMQKDLVGISQWWDSHQKDLQKFSDLFGRLAGDVVTGGGGLIGAFLTTLGQMGGPGGLMGILDSADTFLEKLNAGDTSTAPWWLQLLMDGAHTAPGASGTVNDYASHYTGTKHVRPLTLVSKQTYGGRAAHTHDGPGDYTPPAAALSGWAALGKNLADFGATVGRVFSGIGTVMHTIFKPFLDAVGPQAKSAFASMGQSLGEMWKSSQPFLGFLGQALGTIMGVLGLFIGGLLQLAAVVVQVLAKGMQAGYSMMQQPLEWLRDILKELNQHFLDVANSASKFGNNVHQAVNGISGGAGNFFSGVGTWISSGGRHFADGGHVSGDGWALVGERGPEMVWLPNGAYVAPNRGSLSGYSGGGSSGGGYGGGGASVVVNIYGNGDSYLAQVTQRAVSDALAEQRMVTNTPGGFRTFGALGAG